MSVLEHFNVNLKLPTTSKGQLTCPTSLQAESLLQSQSIQVNFLISGKKTTKTQAIRGYSSCTLSEPNINC